MFNPAASYASTVQTVAKAPAARKVTFAIGAISALYLAFTLAVTVVLQTFGKF